jgi:hypothetical protein
VRHEHHSVHCLPAHRSIARATGRVMSNELILSKVRVYSVGHLGSDLVCRFGALEPEPAMPMSIEAHRHRPREPGGAVLPAPRRSPRAVGSAAPDRVGTAALI